MECLYCGCKYRDKTVLDIHYRTHINERPYLCPKCPTELSSKRSLNHHSKTHIPREDREVKCHFCEKKFLCKSSLKLHLGSHVGKKNFECKICGKKFANPRSFRQHETQHKNINVFACSICTKAFKYLGNLKQHERGVHGIKRYKCHICGTMLSRKCYLNQHLKLHHPQRQRFMCDKCPKSYLTKLLFEEHQLTHHGKDYSFKCDKCEQRFLTSRKLKCHKSHVHLDKAQIFSCVFCGKQSPNFSVFQKHMISHTLERPYLCKLCPAEYREHTSASFHFKISHSKKREHLKCEICPKSFQLKLSLDDHIRQHMGELHYQCKSTGCGMRFPTDSQRKRHFLKAHVGKQICCTVCGKNFLTKDELKLHALVHSDLREHQCQLCDSTFKQRSNLMKHERNLHPNK